jgi:hypothetical protein
MTSKTARTALVIAAVVAALVSVNTATAAGLRVIGKGQASGQFAVTAASGKAKHPRALYLRGYGRGLSGMGVVACSRGFSIGSKATSFNSMRSGRLYKLRLPMRGDCDVTASLSGSGRIRLQILAG